MIDKFSDLDQGYSNTFYHTSAGIPPEKPVPSHDEDVISYSMHAHVESDGGDKRLEDLVEKKAEEVRSLTTSESKLQDAKVTILTHDHNPKLAVLKEFAARLGLSETGIHDLEELYQVDAQMANKFVQDKHAAIVLEKKAIQEAFPFKKIPEEDLQSIIEARNKLANSKQKGMQNVFVESIEKNGEGNPVRLYEVGILKKSAEEAPRLVIGMKEAGGSFKHCMLAAEGGSLKVESDCALLVPKNGVFTKEELKEFELQKSLTEKGVPGIPKILYFDEHCCVMEKISFTMEEFIEDVGLMDSPEELQSYAHGYAKILAKMHELGLLHGDLKPENCGSKNGESYLIDFGFTKEMKDSNNLVKGTPVTMAPEVIAGEERDGKSEVYSLGIILLYMQTGEYLITGSDPMEIFGEVSDQRIQSMKDQTAPLKNFVRNMDDLFGRAVPDMEDESDSEQRFLPIWHKVSDATRTIDQFTLSDSSNREKVREEINGKLDAIGFDEDLKQIFWMTHPNPEMRPTASEVADYFNPTQ